jgi:hypothetical protein
MKKLLVLAALICTASATASAKIGETVDEVKARYAGARNVTWTEKAGVMTAVFRDNPAMPSHFVAAISFLEGMSASEIFFFDDWRNQRRIDSRSMGRALTDYGLDWSPWSEVSGENDVAFGMISVQPSTGMVAIQGWLKWPTDSRDFPWMRCYALAIQSKLLARTTYWWW